MQMPKKAKARDIRAGMYRIRFTNLRRIFVEHCHRGNCFLHGMFRCFSDAVRRTQNADAEFFGQNQRISRLSVIVCIDSFGVYRSHDRQPIFYTVIGNRMPADQRAAGFQYLLRTAAHNLAQDIQIHLFRKTHDVERGFHLSAHRINITQCICRRNLSKCMRIIHHGRKKIQRLYNGQIIRHLIDRCVISAVISDKQVWIRLSLWQCRQHAAQNTCAQFGCAAAAFTKYNFLCHRVFSFAVFSHFYHIIFAEFHQHYIVS